MLTLPRTTPMMWRRVPRQERAAIAAVPMDRIVAEVCGLYGMTADEIAQPGRHKSRLEPRGVCCLLIRELTNRSLKEIGRRLGRDHSTVLHAIANVRAAAENDQAIGDRIAFLRRRITNIAAGL